MKTFGIFVLGASAVLLSASAAFGQANAPTNPPATAATQDTNTPPPPFVVKSADGICDISIDTSGAPDLKQWAETKLAPALSEWFPKIIAELPVPGYTPPTRFSVRIGPGNGVAATSGTRVTANAAWFRGQLNGEAVGALIHEEVHVIQLYRPGGRVNPLTSSKSEPNPTFPCSSYHASCISNIHLLGNMITAKKLPK